MTPVCSASLCATVSLSLFNSSRQLSAASGSPVSSAGTAKRELVGPPADTVAAPRVERDVERPSPRDDDRYVLDDAPGNAREGALAPRREDTEPQRLAATSSGLACTARRLCRRLVALRRRLQYQPTRQD